VGCSALFLDAPRVNSGRAIAVSLDIAFPEVVLLLLSLAWASPASSPLVSLSSVGGRVVVILRSEV
jgi:hypothetical protein